MKRQGTTTRHFGTAAVLYLLALGACDLKPDARTEKPPAASDGMCTRSSQCSGICDTIGNKCVKLHEATCGANGDKDCVRYDGLPLCRDGACVVAECSDDADCGGYSSTTECLSGRCTDNTWGCVSDADNRESPEESGTYELKVIDVTTNAIPPDLTVKLCGSTNDFNCTTPPSSARAIVDLDMGVVRVTNVPPSTQIHFQLFAEGMFDTEFYSQRTVKGRTVEPVGLNMIPLNLVPLLQQAVDIAADTTNNATVLGRVFDCNDKLAPGVKLSTTRFHVAPDGAGSDTRVFYIKEGNLPDPDATITSDHGAAGLINLDGGKQTTLRATYEEHIVAQQVLIPKTGWMTYVHFYPLDYDTIE